jgi:hypothetical protein
MRWKWASTTSRQALTASVVDCDGLHTMAKALLTMDATGTIEVVVGLNDSAGARRSLGRHVER